MESLGRHGGYQFSHHVQTIVSGKRDIIWGMSVLTIHKGGGVVFLPLCFIFYFLKEANWNLKFRGRYAIGVQRFREEIDIRCISQGHMIGILFIFNRFVNEEWKWMVGFVWIIFPWFRLCVYSEDICHIQLKTLV